MWECGMGTHMRMGMRGGELQVCCTERSASRAFVDERPRDASASFFYDPDIHLSYFTSTSISCSLAWRWVTLLWRSLAVGTHPFFYSCPWYFLQTMFKWNFYRDLLLHKSFTILKYFFFSHTFPPPSNTRLISVLLTFHSCCLLTIQLFPRSLPIF